MAELTHPLPGQALASGNEYAFISVAVSKGCNLKWVAEYCGTSVQMIETSYGKYITDDGAEPAPSIA